MKPKYIVLLLFVFASIGCLAGRLAADPLATQLDYIFKPLLMPLLAIYAILQLKKLSRGRAILLILALFFAMGGDVSLMLGRDGLLFMGGLGSFLIMQILYIILFAKDWPRPSLLRRHFWLILPFVVLGLGFYISALPNFQHDTVLTIAVFVYATALTSMSLAALNRQGKVAFQSFLLTFLGAFLFLASDLMIGANKWIFPNFPYAGFAIMVTYIGGQWMIVEGLLRDARRVPTTVRDRDGSGETRETKEARPDNQNAQV